MGGMGFIPERLLMMTMIIGCGQHFPFTFGDCCWGPIFWFCVFVAAWRHDLRSEWPFIIMIVMITA